MGEVWKALDTRLDRFVALKLLPRNLTTDDERVRRFVREAKSASALTHPNIITIYDTDRADVAGAPAWYIAMELVDGETLRARLRRGELDPAAAASLVAQAADALAKAHAHGIVHRDLKPENIMITADGFAKVLDFGLAKLVQSEVEEENLTADGVIVGTISYMSPEQIRGGAVDARSDLFALGCVLYELVSSRRPYAAPTARESLHRTIHDEPPRLELPPELQRIIDRCLRKRPEERVQSAKELAAELRAFVRGVERGAQAPPRSIAVLPFRELTPSHENDHIGLGLADAIITELAASRKLLVRPTSAIVGYRDRAVDPGGAARELGVDAVVDGAFQRAGVRLRVTVQLVNIEGRSLWAAKIDSSLDDLFAMQDEVARRVSESLSVDLAPPQRAPQTHATAYEWLMKGKLALWADTIEKMKEAIDAFTAATASDPAFAPAWAGLADVYARLAFNWDPGGDWYHRAVEASERALAIDGDLAEAHYVRGRLAWSPEGDFDFRTSVAAFAAALRMNPNLAEAHGRLGVLLFHIGAIEEAEEELRRAIAINPADSISVHHLGTCAFVAGDWSRCLERLAERFDEAPHPWAYYIRAHALLRLDRDAEAAECTDRAALLFPESAFYYPLRVVLAAKAGDRARAHEQMHRTIEHEKTYGHYHHTQYDIACAHALLGDTELALEWLRAAARNGYPCALHFERDTLLAPMRRSELDALIAEVRAEDEEYRGLYRRLIETPDADATTLQMT